MDPTRVNYLTKSTKWMDPTRFKYLTVHKMDGPHEGSKFISTKWTNPAMDQYLAHKVDGSLED